MVFGSNRRSRRTVVAVVGVLAVGAGVLSTSVFSTNSANAATCSIAAAGDIASGGGDQAKTAAVVKSLNPTKVVTLGDNAYPDGAPADFARLYDPTWGAFKAITMPAPGNHDYHTAGGSGYLAYFGVKPYYSWDLCGWHLLSLNHELTGAARTAEISWLKSDLAANAGKPMIAYWHEPRWTSGTKHGSDAGAQDLWSTVVNAGVKVVLTGHEHLYERLAEMDATGKAKVGGTREFVVGEGGAGLYPFGTPLATSEKRVSNMHGVMEMTLRPNGYDWKLHQVDGTIADSGSSNFSGTTPAPVPAPTPSPTPSPVPAPTPNPVPVPVPVPVPSPTPSPVPLPEPVPGPISSGVKSVVFKPTIDGHVKSESTNLARLSETYITIGNAPGLGERRGYMKFTVSGVPSGATAIKSKLTVTGFATDSTPIKVYVVSDNNWSASTLSWAAQPKGTRTLVGTINGVTSGKSVSIDTSALVKGNGTYTLEFLAPTSNDVSRLYSSESTHSPKLTVSWS